MNLFGYEITKRVKNTETALPIGSRSAGVNNVFTTMTPKELLSNTTVASCVSLIADSIALLSCHVYKRTAHGRERDDSPNLAYLLHVAPNYYDTPFTFFQTIGLHLTLKGNVFLFIERYYDYSVKSLTPLDPDKVEIKFDAKGEIYYEYTVNGQVYKYTTEHILHIPAYRYNTIRGMSPMEYANHAAHLGLRLDEYTNNSFDGGIHSKLKIEVPIEEKKFSEPDAKKLIERINSAYGGVENGNKPFILAHGYKAEELKLATNADAQLAENRTFSEKEIAKIFRVPLYMLGKDDAKFTNQEQANTFFLQHTLTPWLVRIQQYFNRLLTFPYRDNHYVEFDTDSLLRADYKSRIEMQIKGVLNGIYTPNQVYDMENLPRTKEAWGDKHFMPVNISTVDKIAAQTLDDAKNQSTGRNTDADK